MKKKISTIDIQGEIFLLFNSTKNKIEIGVGEREMLLSTFYRVDISKCYQKYVMYNI